ncbi:MAG: type IV pilus assembly protein PilM [Actinobacteria bacterium]|nr:type IV pilus assembly protein PilM [Actinomycetota bacterium]
MAAKNKIAWGIDVGQYGLRAIKLEVSGENLQVSDFEVIDYPKSLPSMPAASHDQTIRKALGEFAAQHSLKGSVVVVGVPGRNSQARFVALPPVEAKKIPQIVEFEAKQQIPFDIDDVVWDYQAIRMADSPDVVAGIFFIKRDVVDSFLENFQQAGILANQVQMAPMALYNALVYDGMTHPEGATVILDVGSANTEFVVADGQKVFHRTIPIGGNNFTQALVKTFKLSFTKAENLKRKCSTSKYAKQVFQAMRSVFSDLSSEVQRSIGFYTTLNRQAKVSRVLAMGNTFRLPGLQKYLQQSLRVEFIRVDQFSRLTLAPQLRPPAFSAAILSMGVAYGLALQGLGRATIDVNLLPPSIARQQAWRAKKPVFAAAVALLAFIVAGTYARNFMDLSVVNSLLEDESANAPTRIIERAEQYKLQLDQADARVKAEREKIGEFAALLSHRDVFPVIMRAISRTLDVCDDPNIELAKPRSQRRLVFLQDFSCKYSEDLDGEFAKKYGKDDPTAPAPTFTTGGYYSPAPRREPKKGFIMEIRGITPFQGDSQYKDTWAFLSEKIVTGLPDVVKAELAKLQTQGSGLPNWLVPLSFSAPTYYKPNRVEFVGFELKKSNKKDQEDESIKFPDPTRPTESMAKDWYFCIHWKVYVGPDAAGDATAEQSGTALQKKPPGSRAVPPRTLRGR